MARCEPSWATENSVYIAKPLARDATQSGHCPVSVIHEATPMMVSDNRNKNIVGKASTGRCINLLKYCCLFGSTELALAVVMLFLLPIAVT